MRNYLVLCVNQDLQCWEQKFLVLSQRNFPVPSYNQTARTVSQSHSRPNCSVCSGRPGGSQALRRGEKCPIMLHPGGGETPRSPSHINCCAYTKLSIKKTILLDPSTWVAFLWLTVCLWEWLTQNTPAQRRHSIDAEACWETFVSSEKTIATLLMTVSKYGVFLLSMLGNVMKNTYRVTSLYISTQFVQSVLYVYSP